MELLENAIKRVDAFLGEINNLKGLDFAYQASRDALEIIENVILTHRKELESSKESSQKSIKEACKKSLDCLSRNIPLLGFILRSTNVRNAFEIYGPLRRLSSQALKKDINNTKLIISSEWERYSPFMYLEGINLSSFVLIGFPAPESSNPLLIPLAGHELGHTLWSELKLKNVFYKTLENKILKSIKNNIENIKKKFQYVTGLDDLFVNNIITYNAINFALRQIEEYFCDFIGLRIFGDPIFMLFLIFYLHLIKRIPLIIIQHFKIE